MKPNAEGWTIVVAGLWNVRIFTPEWVAKNAFESNEIETEIVMGALIPTILAPVSLRFRCGNLILVPAFDRIILGVSSPTDKALLQAERAAVRIVESLPHTPISAFGVNFAFIEDVPTAGDVELFSLRDLPIIPYEITQSEITRRLRLESSFLNLKHTLHQGILRLDFNFHHDTRAPEDVFAGLPGAVLKSKAIAYDLLKAYKFEPEENDAVTN